MLKLKKKMQAAVNHGVTDESTNFSFVKIGGYIKFLWKLPWKLEAPSMRHALMFSFNPPILDSMTHQGSK